MQKIFSDGFHNRLNSLAILFICIIKSCEIRMVQTIPVLYYRSCIVVQIWFVLAATLYAFSLVLKIQSILSNSKMPCRIFSIDTLPFTPGIMKIECIVFPILIIWYYIAYPSILWLIRKLFHTLPFALSYVCICNFFIYKFILSPLSELSRKFFLFLLSYYLITSYKQYY